MSSDKAHKESEGVIVLAFRIEKTNLTRSKSSLCSYFALRACTAQGSDIRKAGRAGPNRYGISAEGF